MLKKRKIKTFIVEDDAVQAEVLKDKLSATNDLIKVKVFSDGSAMLRYLDQGYKKKNAFTLLFLTTFFKPKKKRMF